jgi:hypothetical protein
MKTEVLIQEPPVAQATHSLHDIVDIIAQSMEYAALHNKSFIINDVREDILIDTDQDLLSNTLSSLVNEVIRHTENGCIRISAKSYKSNIILLHVKNDGCLNYDSVSQKLTRIQTQAERLGGFVGFTSYRNKLTTIAFSFRNMQPAA